MFINKSAHKKNLIETFQAVNVAQGLRRASLIARMSALMPVNISVAFS